MAKNVTLVWVLPTRRTGGALLPPEEIDRVDLEISVDGGVSFTPVRSFMPDEEQSNLFPDLEVGNWQFGLTVFDTAGRSSGQLVFEVLVADDSPPNRVSGVTAIQD